MKVCTFDGKVFADTEVAPITLVESVKPKGVINAFIGAADSSKLYFCSRDELLQWLEASKKK